MFEHSPRLSSTFDRLLRTLRGCALPHVFVGPAALSAYGARDPDPPLQVCLRLADLDSFLRQVAGYEFERLPGRRSGLYDRETQIEIESLPAGGFAGDRLRYPEIRWPDPSEAVEPGGIPVPTLARLIELLIVQGGPRQLACVAELVRANGLDGDFAAQLHPVVRGGYLESLGFR